MRGAINNINIYFELIQGPFDFALLGANRQVLRVRVAQLRSQDLRIQFAGNVGAPNATAAPAQAMPGGAPGQPTQPVGGSASMPGAPGAAQADPAPAAQAANGPPAAPSP